VLAGRLLPLASLTSRFPAEDRLLSLAYEQSESVVKYIEREYGTGKILALLDALTQGRPLDDAVQQIFSTEPGSAGGWMAALSRHRAHLGHLFQHPHLRDTLFVAALLAVIGCVKLIVRRKRRRLEEDEEREPSG